MHIATRFVLSSIDAVKITKGSAFKEIDIRNNRLREIIGWEVFTRLKRLFASNNELQRVELNNHPNLMLLDLSFNQLTHMPNLNALVNLRELNLRNNFIGECNLSNISQCTRIESINLSWNNVEWDTNTLNDVVFQLLPKFKKLKNINFANNPFSSNMVNYRAVFISRLFRSLKIFDEMPVTHVESVEAQLTAPVKPLFAADIKAMMVNTSATKVSTQHTVVVMMMMMTLACCFDTHLGSHFLESPTDEESSLILTNLQEDQCCSALI